MGRPQFLALSLAAIDRHLFFFLLYYHESYLFFIFTSPKIREEKDQETWFDHREI